MKKIEAIPAIDLIDGKCVRLRQGDYSQKTVYADHPEEMAKAFERMGFTRLHLVDLDGARRGRPENTEVLKKITEATTLSVDFGGGIKTEVDIETVLGCGAAMVTIGSIAVTNPDQVLSWKERYGEDKIIIGADVRDGMVSIHGWQEDSDMSLYALLDFYTSHGLTKYLCTDISRDGMLSGPSIQLYREIMERYPEIHVIASGGISNTDGVLALEQAGIPAVVFGKAFYEGHIDTEKILRR